MKVDVPRSSTQAQNGSDKLLIIHVSDMHIDGKDVRLPQRVQSLVEALQYEEADVAAAIVVVSGDIAWSGKKEQYEIAGRILTDLTKQIQVKLGVGSVFTIVVPGNHDCLLEETDTVRDIVIIETLRSNEPKIDKRIIDVCSSVQQKFFDFKEALVQDGLEESKKNQLYWEESLSIGSRSVLFRCFNTAWLSRLHEKPGNLFLPPEVAENPASPNSADYVASILHHPYNWFVPNNNRLIGGIVGSSSDLVMTGHEHDPDQYVKRKVTHSQESLYLEGAIFGGTLSGAQYGFSAIWIDLASRRQRIRSYTWNGARFESCDNDPDWIDYSRGTNRRGECELTPTQREWLQDAGTSFVHPQRGKLSLSDIFVSPAFREVLNDKTLAPNLRKTILGADLLSDTLNSTGRKIIYGPTVSGKTTFAKVIYGQAFEHGMTPIYVTCSNAPKSHESAKVGLWVQRAFEEQYRPAGRPELSRIPKDKVVLLIDGFEDLKTRSEGRIEFLKTLTTQYPRVVVFSSDVVKLEDLAGGSVGAGLLQEFKQYDLLSFGHRKRSELVEKWESLFTPQITDDYEYENKLHQNEELLNQVLGRSYLPARPVYLLALLQGLAASSSFGSAIGTYGSLYELLISHQLAACDSNAASAFNTRKTYLSELAFWMFKRGIYSLSTEEWEDFHHFYCEKYGVNYDRAPFERDFLKCAITEQRDQRFLFRYKYVYYYFVAKYLCDNLHLVEVSDLVRQLANELQDEEKANIWLFLTHLSKNPLVLEVITEHARSIFADCAPANFDDGLSFIQSLQSQVPQVVVDLNQDYRLEKMRRLDQMDSHDRGQETKREELADENLKIRDGMRTLEILGQAVRNFPGSLEGNVKQILVQEAYQLGLRISGQILSSLQEHIDVFLQMVTEMAESRYPETKLRFEFEQRVRSLIFSIYELFCFVMVRAITRSVGHPDLAITYGHVLGSDTGGSKAIQLIDLSIRLDNLTFPENEIMAAWKAFKGNILCQSLLRRLVAFHFDIHKVRPSTKQRVCAKLAISLGPSLTRNISY